MTVAAIGGGDSIGGRVISLETDHTLCPPKDETPDPFCAPVGTSFSAPLVTGTVALMRAGPDAYPGENQGNPKKTGADANWCRTDDFAKPETLVPLCSSEQTIKQLNAEAAVREVLNSLTPYTHAHGYAHKTAYRKLEGGQSDSGFATPTPTPTSQEDSRSSRNGAKFLKMSFYTIPSPEPASGFPSSFADECTYPEIIGLPVDETRARLYAFLECIPQPLSVVPQQFHGYYVFLAFDTEATQEDFTMPVKIQLIQHNPKSGAATVFSELEVTVNHSDILEYTVTRGVFDYLIILPPQYSYEIRVLDDRGVEIVSSDFSAGLSLDQYRSKLPNIQLPNIAAPLISHGLEPALNNTLDFSIDWRVVTKMAGADLLKLTWLLEFDTTAAPMNLPFAAVVRWVDVTDPDRPVVLSGAGQDYQGTGFGRSYYRASRGTGELGYWKPGRYQVRLIDRNSGEILAYLSFEVN